MMNDERDDFLPSSTEFFDHYLNFDWSSEQIEFLKKVGNEFFYEQDYFLPNISNQAEIRKILSLKTLSKIKDSSNTEKLPFHLEPSNFEIYLNQFIETNFSEIQIEQLKESNSVGSLYCTAEKEKLLSLKRSSNDSKEDENSSFNLKKIKIDNNCLDMENNNSNNNTNETKNIEDGKDSKDSLISKTKMNAMESLNCGTFTKSYPNYTKKSLAIQQLNEKRSELKLNLNSRRKLFQLQLKKMKLSKYNNTSLNDCFYQQQEEDMEYTKNNNNNNSAAAALEEEENLDFEVDDFACFNFCENDLNLNINQIEILNQRYI
ncbi:hypothetical protein HK099_001884, partial [Clydaea vesicula]